MIQVSRVLRLPTERSWSWAPFKKAREVAEFPALRVLFCGSDHFSVPSFTMLRELHLRHNDIVSELAVVTPTDKFTGRGMKIRKAAPMTLLARKMNYEPSHVSRFQMTLDELPLGNWDLLIAVSFGHKITPEVLDKMTHGGLNVHPSLLPRYRGPAPLHHTLLNDDAETGVSIQTLHPTKFDQGAILMQSEPFPLQDMSLDGLNTKTARLGADMLRALLTRGYPVNAPEPLETDLQPSYAPKISKEELEIDWTTWPASKIVRWSKVTNGLWTRLGETIVKLKDLDHHEVVANADDLVGNITMSSAAVDVNEKHLLVKCLDGNITIGRLTVAGKSEKPGSRAQELHGKRFGKI